MMKYRIFISSVQREFAKDRKALAEYVHKDVILGRHRSIPENLLLAQSMYLRSYIEHVGSGVGDIIEKCRESGLPPPQWEGEDDGLTIVLRRATIAAQPQTDKGAQMGDRELSRVGASSRLLAKLSYFGWARHHVWG